MALLAKLVSLASLPFGLHAVSAMSDWLHSRLVLIVWLQRHAQMQGLQRIPIRIVRLMILSGWLTRMLRLRHPLSRIISACRQLRVIRITISISTASRWRMC